MRLIIIFGILSIAGMGGCSQPSRPKEASTPTVEEQHAASTPSSSLQTHQSHDQATNKATIAFNDGSTVELHDFAFCTGHQSPNSFYPAGKSSRKEELRLQVGRFWHLVRLEQLKVLERQPNHDPRQRHWLGVNLVLTSGEQQSGRLPLVCDVTWLECNSFEFGGKTSVLGAKGDFSIGVDDLQSIVAQGSSAHYEVKDTSGKATVVDSLTYQSHSEPPINYTKAFEFYGQPFNVVVGRSKVPVKLEQIESITFPRRLDNSIHFQMRSGEAADGRFSEDERVERGFGRTTDDLIWFQELSDWKERTWLVKSVTFGPLQGKR